MPDLNPNLSMHLLDALRSFEGLLRLREFET